MRRLRIGTSAPTTTVFPSTGISTSSKVFLSSSRVYPPRLASPAFQQLAESAFKVAIARVFRKMLLLLRSARVSSMERLVSLPESGIARALEGQQTACGISLMGVKHSPPWPSLSLTPEKKRPKTARSMERSLILSPRIFFTLVAVSSSRKFPILSPSQCIITCGYENTNSLDFIHFDIHIR